uniref:Uncharacterized protein n=1 Tax=Rhodotorula toruloides TaxID=5286 RepID=A0A0K3CJ66_RHOTO
MSDAKPLPNTPCTSGSSTAYQPLSKASLKQFVEHAVKGAVAQAVDQVLAHRFAYEQNLRTNQERKAEQLQAQMSNLSTQMEELQAQLKAQDGRAEDYKRKMEGRLHEMEEREARMKKEVSDMRQELTASSSRLESGLGGLVGAYNGMQESLASETNRSFFWVHNKCQELLDTTKTSYSNELNKVFDTVIELSERAQQGQFSLREALDDYTFTLIPPVSDTVPGKRSSSTKPRSSARSNGRPRTDSPTRTTPSTSSALPHPLTRTRPVKKVRIQEPHSPATALPPHAGTSKLRSSSDQSHLPPPPVTNIARTEEVLLYWDEELGMRAVRRIWIIAEEEK